MKKLIVIFLIQLFMNISLLAGTGRPVLYGFAPAYPDKVPELFSSDVKSPYLTIEKEYTLLLDIDKKGKVVEITPINENETRIKDYSKKYLDGCRFVPALFNGEKVSSVLPVKIIINPRISTPDFYFPVSSNLNIKNPDLYYLTYELNSISLPSIMYFPKYFCNIDWKDSLDSYPFILLQLDLDDKGEVKNVKEVLSTYSNYTMTLKSASLWSEFIPPSVNDSNISSSPYLLVSLFPQIYYPTHPFKNNMSDSVSIHEKNRLKLLPDTLGIMQKPIPRIFGGNEIIVPNIPLWLNDTLSLFVTVDTTGRTIVNRSGKTNKDTYRIMKDILSKVKFYPAIDFNGKPTEYSGLIWLIIKGSDKVRIKYLW